jgi:hypothetical protein
MHEQKRHSSLELLQLPLCDIVKLHQPLRFDLLPGKPL